MTKSQVNLIKLICIAFIMAVTSSCMNDDNNGTYYSTIGSLEKADGINYLIATDSGRKLLISNSTEVAAEAKAGDRLYVEFTFDSEEPQGYDGKIDIFYLYKILVKDPVHLTAENSNEIGDDYIFVSEIWATDKYLNFRFQYFSGGDKTHYINLVTVDEPKKTEDGYLYVEFRHNANNDVEQYPYNGIVSFNTDKLLSENPSLKGLIIRMKTYSAGDYFYKLNFEDKADNNTTKMKLGTSMNAGDLK